jgi:hypothetical protein
MQNDQDRSRLVVRNVEIHKTPPTRAGVEAAKASDHVQFVLKID